MVEDELLKAQKIDHFELQIYQLFNTELGHSVLTQMKENAFFESPTVEEFSKQTFAWCDGRKSVIREIILTVEKVRSIIRENNYVG